MFRLYTAVSHGTTVLRQAIYFHERSLPLSIPGVQRNNMYPNKNRTLKLSKILCTVVASVETMSDDGTRTRMHKTLTYILLPLYVLRLDSQNSSQRRVRVFEAWFSTVL